MNSRIREINKKQIHRGIQALGRLRLQNCSSHLSRIHTKTVSNQKPLKQLPNCSKDLIHILICSSVAATKH